MKADRSISIKQTGLSCGLLLLASAYGCAGSQAAHQIQEGRLALLTGNPEIAVQHFEQAAALDSENSGSPLQESAWTYVGRAYYGTMKYSLARQHLDRALGQNKDDDIARLYVGLIGAREQMNESSRKQIQAGLQGVYDRIEYIKHFTFAGEFWDPSGQLSAELLALIKAVSAPQGDWSSVIPRIEQLGLKIENEVDQAHRDELNRYRSGSSGGGDM
jgi:tetratricopeptide (TPR) repeat protein